MRVYTMSDLERFWSKVAVGESTACWLWIAEARAGLLQYGMFTFGSIHVSAPRFSWYIHTGVWPEDLEVAHKCDEPLCVNPKHLFLTAHKGNMEDMARKGRMSSTLTEANVREIREKYAGGDVPYHQLAEAYGVSTICIFHVIKRDTWSHV